MTPAEGAFYLGVPNLILVGLPDPKVPCSWKPETPDFDAYAISFRPLKKVVWFIGRGYLRMNSKDLEAVRQLAQKFPNIVGVVMDDFFRFTLDGSEVGNLTPDELAYIQSQLKVDGRKLDLWITLYDHNLEYEIAPYLRHVDVVTYWTSYAKNLEKLREGFERLEKVTGHRKVLGCYMWDYGSHSPMPVALMQKQCELGLQWLREGRIEGMIFLGSGSCDLELDAVEWTRDWIQKVGDEKL